MSNDLIFNSELLFCKQIQFKVTNNNVIISKPEKGNSIFIMDKSDYIVKVEVALNCSSLNGIKN